MREAAGDWETVSRYLRLLYSGSPAELETYVALLVVLKTFVLKGSTPLVPGVAQDGAATNTAGTATADFTNGTGMQMVRLASGRWASKFETTQAQYRRVAGNNPSLFADPVRPVETVTWHQAVAYCDKVTALEAAAARLPAGFVYRLPTSEEFEYLAAGSTLKNSVTATQTAHWHTAPAGSLPPNPLGVHDAVGNVWEWGLDWGDRGRRVKVSNGGSWISRPPDLAYRSGPDGRIDLGYGRVLGPQRKDYPDQRFWNRGFRCVLAPPAKADA